MSIFVEMGRCGLYARRLGAGVAAVLAMVLPAAALAVSNPGESGASPGLDQKATLRASQAVVGNTVSDFTLLDREGRPVRLSQFRGKPLLVSFIYTGCFQVCPLTTRSLQSAVEVGRKAFGTRQFNVVSIGFNQPADSPTALKSFALQHRIDQPNWEFLSPHMSIVQPLMREFGFSQVATPAGFDHVLQVSLLDAEGRVFRQIYGEELTAGSIGEPLKELLNQVPAAQQVGVQEIVDRIRILCTVYDPATGKYQVKYGLLIEVAGGITFALFMIWFFAAEWLNRRRARRLSKSWGNTKDGTPA